MEKTVPGEPKFTSLVRLVVSDTVQLPDEILQDSLNPVQSEFFFELAGSLKKLYLNPKEKCAGIVICCGLCPGLNDVIRSISLELHYACGVKEILGFRGG
jgi:6-phosphofructokinase 1